MSAKYKVGLSNPHPPFVFNRIHIEMNENGDAKASSEEFMDTISPMDIPRTRRKQNADRATNEELLVSFELLES